MAATGTTSSQGSSLPQEIDLDSKIFGTKVEQIQRLLRAGWNLGTDEALQADYTKLQPKHGTSDDDDTKTVQGDEKDQAATGKRITRAAPKATEVKADTEEPRPQAPRPAATGTLPIPLGHPPQGARDLGFPPEFQHWLDEDTSRRPPPPPDPTEGRTPSTYHLEGLKIIY